jgi:hypothetical protein
VSSDAVWRFCMPVLVVRSLLWEIDIENSLDSSLKHYFSVKPKLHKYKNNETFASRVLLVFLSN